MRFFKQRGFPLMSPRMFWTCWTRMHSNAGAAQVLAKLQALDDLHKYLARKEHTMLDAADKWSGCSFLSKRLRLLGVRSRKESTKKDCDNFARAGCFPRLQDCSRACAYFGCLLSWPSDAGQHIWRILWSKNSWLANAFEDHMGQDHFQSSQGRRWVKKLEFK